MYQWVFWKVVVLLFLLVFVALPWLWKHIHLKAAAKLLFSVLAPRPHAPKPDIVEFAVTYSSTPTSVKFEWRQQVVHLWGGNTVCDRIWERFTSPRNVVIQAGTEQFVGLTPGTDLYVFPLIYAKTGAVAWDKKDAFSYKDYPYPEAIKAATTSSGTGGGGCCRKTHLVW
jgi:hypothetical protein